MLSIRSIFFPITQGALPWQPILCIKKNTKRAIFAIFTPYESALGVDDRSEVFFNISSDVTMATNFVS